MAIIIPSKNIYRINFDSVIDNNIDKVKVTAMKAVPDNIYSSAVYNESIYYGQGQAQSQILPNRSSSIIAGRGEFNGGVWQLILGAGVTIIDKYFTFNIQIPKSQKNKRITKIFQGKNPTTNEPYIGVSKSIEETIYYEQVPDAFKPSSIDEINVATSNIFNFIKITAHNYSVDNILEKNTSGNLTRRSIHFYPEVEEGTPQEGILSNWIEPKIGADNDLADSEEVKCQVSAISSHAGAYLSKSEVNTYETDLSSITYVDETYDYVFYNVKLLFSREIYAPATAIYVPLTFDRFKSYPAKVVKCEQKAVRADITIYGNAIGVDFEDESISIGNGNKVFSFDGNELIQTTNTPTQETKYQGVIDNWKDGKQTLIISCPITDYYDENDNKVIDTSVSGKMIFKEGDVVIPYTYTNKGDKPISYNKNFTPKQFKVVGTSILKSQGGTQKLTLVEI